MSEGRYKLTADDAMKLLECKSMAEAEAVLFTPAQRYGYGIDRWRFEFGNEGMYVRYSMGDNCD